MTIKEKFIEVFGEEPQRQYATKSWWEQEYVPDHCDFCETIYPDDDTQDIVFGRGKYSVFNKDSFITIDDEGDYHVNIDPGDPYEIGYLFNIKFCPYCGRKLAERSGTDDL